MSLENKVILVTGAARGMGREMTRAFLENGAKVIATDLSWVPTGVSNDDYDFRAELQAHDTARVFTMGVIRQSHVDAFYRRAIEAFGTIDVIVANGGTRQRDLYHEEHGSISLLDTDTGEWERMFGTHVFGNLRVIKRFVKPILENQRGSIITVASSQVLQA